MESEVVNRTEVFVDLEVEAETSDVQVQEKDSQSEQIHLPPDIVTTQAEAIDTNLNVLDKASKDNPQRLGEYVEEEDFKFEEYSEGGVDTTVTEPKELPVTEVIQVKEGEVKREVEMKNETEPNHEAGQEIDINRSWLEEAVNQSEKEDDTSSVTTEVFDISLVNMDVTEVGWDSGNDSDVTISWSPKIETLNLKEPETSVSNKFHSLDKMSQDSEEESLLPFGLKRAYVAMKSAIIDKVVRKKKKKKPKKNRWQIDSEDTEWSPIKMKKMMKIVLVKTKVQETSSESSANEKVQPSPWKRNNHRWLQKTDIKQKQNRILKDKQERADRRQVRNLLTTDKKSQASLLQFHKSNWEREQLLKAVNFRVMLVTEDREGSNTKVRKDLSSVHLSSFPPYGRARTCPQFGQRRSGS